MKRLFKRYRVWRLSKKSQFDLLEEKYRLEDKLMSIDLEFSRRTWVNRTEPVTVNEGALWRQHDNHNLPEFKTKVGEI